MKINLPTSVREIISRIEGAGYEAYAVGGCIRDSVRGDTPEDWDICTNALPEAVESIFSGMRVIETGLQHGTVTVMIDRVGYEITTYRTEGSYSDRRKPDFVKFVSELREDVNRRDFTINAMAYNDKNGLQDYFGGREDLENGIIRCVGDADARFNEDALRILRAMRFAARFDFTIAPETAAAMHKNKALLSYVSRERISAELMKLLRGCGAAHILREFSDILLEFIPDIEPCIGFDQHSVYHSHDVWEHTLAAVEAAEPDSVVRLAVLLHDIGKPSCFTIDEKGGHFYGHAEIGARLADDIIKRLKMSNDIRRTVTTLIRYHDGFRAMGEKGMKRLINKIGMDNTRLLLKVFYADTIAHAEKFVPERLKLLDELTAALDRIESSNECFSLKDLAMNGKDLIAMGIEPGRDLGNMLNKMLEAVIDGRADNTRESLTRLIENQQLLLLYTN